MQHNIFPSSQIDQVTFDDDVDDQVVEEVVRMSEFANVTDVYLRSWNITDRGLQALNQFSQMTYVYIDSPAISEDCITDFKEQHPDCRVIVPIHASGSSSGVSGMGFPR